MFVPKNRLSRWVLYYSIVLRNQYPAVCWQGLDLHYVMYCIIYWCCKVVCTLIILCYILMNVLLQQNLVSVLHELFTLLHQHMFTLLKLHLMLSGSSLDSNLLTNWENSVLYCVSYMLYNSHRKVTSRDRFTETQKSL